MVQHQEITSAPSGIYSGQPQPNPKGHANAIILWSGIELEGPVDKRVINNVAGKSMEKEYEKVVDKDIEKELITVMTNIVDTYKAKEVVEKDK